MAGFIVNVDISHILSEMLANNRGPDPMNPDLRRRPNYGIVGTLNGGVADVVLTFHRGDAYCCNDWGCHLALWHGKRWNRLRQLMTSQGLTAPARLELRLKCVIEDGAIFFDMFRPDPSRRGWYAFAPVAAQTYEASAMEAECESIQTPAE